MTTLQLVQLLAAMASVLAAGLLWATLTRLKREAVRANEDLLKAKDGQIAALTKEALTLRELTPIKIREFLMEHRRQLRDFSLALENACQSARETLEDPAIAAPEAAARRAALLAVTRGMQPHLRELQHQCEFPEDFRIRLARMAPDVIQQLSEAYLELARLLPLAGTAQVQELSARIVQSGRYRLDENTLFSDQLFTRSPGDPAGGWQRPDNGE
jgi:hypothetical protein